MNTPTLNQKSHYIYFDLTPAHTEVFEIPTKNPGFVKQQYKLYTKMPIMSQQEG